MFPVSCVAVHLPNPAHPCIQFCVAMTVEMLGNSCATPVAYVSLMFFEPVCKGALGFTHVQHERAGGARDGIDNVLAFTRESTADFKLLLGATQSSSRFQMETGDTTWLIATVGSRW